MYDKHETNLREFKGYSIKRIDPYGFWAISALKGPTPNILSGNFTSAEKATKQIDLYLDNKKPKRV